MEKKEEKEERCAFEGKSSSVVNFEDKKLTVARSRVPFHIPTIPRPQEEYGIRPNNRSEPFQHVWLQKSEDGTRFIHPLERFTELYFANKNAGVVEPVKPLPMECTPFKLVDDLKDLKELAAKLHAVDEFAVDLEHNKYRSFQGLTCLMQISTRTEDFVVDTLKLRIYIGPHLREIFKDPLKKKVMHGADCDILWLQRDFSIYVCNLFDTGQASKVLQLERNSLEYLVNYFCGVTVNKEYQNADWRQRPLPDEMLKYAREDTHYLLYISDIMRDRLISAARRSKDGNDLLLEVYRRSYDVCLQLYEKELLTDTSYLHIYGLQGSDFNAQQLSVVAGLCRWRDAVARDVDESTGYILPNKALLEIARELPLTSGKLRRLVKSKYPHVEWSLISVMDVITDSIKNSAAFERVAQELQRGHQETVTEQKTIASNELEALNISEVPIYMMQTPVESLAFRGMVNRVNGVVKKELADHPRGVLQSTFISSRWTDTNTNMGNIRQEKPVAGAAGHMPNKPSPYFGTLLENPASNRKLTTGPKDKVEQIILPFDLVKSRNEQLKPVAANSRRETQQCKQPIAKQTRNTMLNCFSLGWKLPQTHSSQEIQHHRDQPSHALPRNSSDYVALIGSAGTQGLKNVGGGSMSPSALSSNFQGCLQLRNVTRENKQLASFAASISSETQQRKPIAKTSGNTMLKDVSWEWKPPQTENSQETQHPRHQQPSYTFPTASSDHLVHRDNARTRGPKTVWGESMSFSQLTSNLQGRLELTNETRENGTTSQELESGLHTKGIDHAAAREQMRCREHPQEEMQVEGDGGCRDLLTSRERWKSSDINRILRDKETEFAAG